MGAKCRYYILQCLGVLVLVSLVLLIIFSLMYLKPYVESKKYVDTLCVMGFKNPHAAWEPCLCGTDYVGTQLCGAAYVNVPITGVKHALLHLDDTQTSKKCTNIKAECGSPYNLFILPKVGETFPCLYDPDNHSRVIWHHQPKSLHLPLLILPGVLFVILTSLFIGMCCYFTKKGLSFSSGVSICSRNTKEET